MSFLLVSWTVSTKFLSQGWSKLIAHFLLQGQNYVLLQPHCLDCPS